MLECPGLGWDSCVCVGWSSFVVVKKVILVCFRAADDTKQLSLHYENMYATAQTHTTTERVVTPISPAF